ncbi:MAG TPA: sigma-70 family RNA polymerase sigma factor [Terriglobales bacterium]
MRPEGIPNRDLVDRCIRSDSPELWEEFVVRTRRLVSAMVFRIARRWGESRSEVLEDLVQETYLHLYANDRRVLREFHPQSDDAVFGFIKVVAGNVTHDHFRASNAMKRGAERTTNSDEESSFRSAETLASHSGNIEQQVLLGEIESCLEKLLSGPDAPKYKTIFWLYYRQGWSASAIAEIPAFGLSTKGVESLIYRVTRALREKLAGTAAASAIVMEPTKGTTEI